MIIAINLSLTTTAKHNQTKPPTLIECIIQIHAKIMAAFAFAYMNAPVDADDSING